MGCRSSYSSKRREPNLPKGPRDLQEEKKTVEGILIIMLMFIMALIIALVVWHQIQPTESEDLYVPETSVPNRTSDRVERMWEHEQQLKRDKDRRDQKAR